MSPTLVVFLFGVSCFIAGAVAGAFVLAFMIERRLRETDEQGTES